MLGLLQCSNRVAVQTNYSKLWRLTANERREIEHDTHLLEVNSNERSITHRLGIYLQEAFEEWDVDCEYNRDHNLPDLVKRLQPNRELIRADDTNAKTVFPDIIIHHRGTEENLLVIEVKKSTNAESDEPDERKHQAFKGSQLEYRYALFLRFYTGHDFQESLGLLKVQKWI